LEMMSDPGIPIDVRCSPTSESGISVPDRMRSALSDTALYVHDLNPSGLPRDCSRLDWWNNGRSLVILYSARRCGYIFSSSTISCTTYILKMDRMAICSPNCKRYMQQTLFILVSR
jgi:hypothetical protein